MFPATLSRYFFRRYLSTFLTYCLAILVVILLVDFNESGRRLSGAADYTVRHGPFDFRVAGANHPAGSDPLYRFDCLDRHPAATQPQIRTRGDTRGCGYFGLAVSRTADRCKPV
jgi:hypothetical protein